MRLIVGLGNPGKEYAGNRHNVGFRCVSELARRRSARFDSRQCRARTARVEIAGETVLLAKPGLFVNLSGKAVSCLMQKHGVLLSELLIVYDDLDLPLGKVRLRRNGGSGGHKGMDSVISALGSNAFPRIRVGIGRPQNDARLKDEDAVVDFVLSNFSAEEEEIVDSAVAVVIQAIECLLTDGMDAAMGRCN